MACRAQAPPTHSQEEIYTEPTRSQKQIYQGMTYVRWQFKPSGDRCAHGAGYTQWVGGRAEDEPRRGAPRLRISLAQKKNYARKRRRPTNPSPTSAAPKIVSDAGS